MTEDTYPTYKRTPADVRMRRDRKLAATDCLVIRHRDQADAGAPTSLTTQQYDDLLAYRQALRDVAEQGGFPEDVAWPTPPAFVA